jgi:hypothetical protein
MSLQEYYWAAGARPVSGCNMGARRGLTARAVSGHARAALRLAALRGPRGGRVLGGAQPQKHRAALAETAPQAHPDTMLADMIFSPWVICCCCCSTAPVGLRAPRLLAPRQVPLLLASGRVGLGQRAFGEERPEASDTTLGVPFAMAAARATVVHERTGRAAGSCQPVRMRTVPSAPHRVGAGCVDTPFETAGLGTCRLGSSVAGSSVVGGGRSRSRGTSQPAQHSLRPSMRRPHRVQEGQRRWSRGPHGKQLARVGRKASPADQCL